MTKHFHPPAFVPGPRPKIELFREPDDSILILGEMIRDVGLMRENLQTLPFDIEAYRGQIRVVLTAAVRMKKRCERLLGEEPDPPADDAIAGLRKVRDTFDPKLGESEPSTIIDAEPEASTKIDAFPFDPPTPTELKLAQEIHAEMVDSPNLVEPHHSELREEVARGKPAKKKPGPKPKATATGPAPGSIQERLLQELKDGPVSSHELAGRVGGLGKATYNALTEMRVAGLIVSKKIGEEWKNQLA